MFVGIEEIPAEIYGNISTLESQKQTLQEVIVEWCDVVQSLGC